jgi:uncharacterized MAPEG superfamily protein
MTVPFWCLFIGALLPTLLAFTGGYFKSQQFDSVDNNNPREQSAQLTGAGARVVAAQSNAWEALAVFTAAVTVNHLGDGAAGTAATASMIWVAARLVHAGAYLADLAPVRSLAFLVGTVCSITLFLSPAL